MNEYFDVLDLLILRLMLIHEEDLYVNFSMQDLLSMEENILAGFGLSKAEANLLANRDFYDFSWVDICLEGFLSFLSKNFSNDWSIDGIKHISILLANRTHKLKDSYLDVTSSNFDSSHSLESLVTSGFPQSTIFG